MKYFPAIQDKKESSNIDNPSRESKLSTSSSTSTSTSNAFLNQSNFLSGIVGGKGTAIMHVKRAYYINRYQVLCYRFTLFNPYIQ